MLDEYTQDINEEFLQLMAELEGADQPMRKQTRYLEDDNLSNWRNIAKNEHDRRDNRYINNNNRGGYGGNDSG